MSIIDQLLLKLSLFRGSEEGLKELIIELFQQVAKEFNLERCFCKLFDNHAICILSYEWQDSSFNNPEDPVSLFNFGEFEWSLQQLSRIVTVAIDSATTLPIEAKAEKDYMLEKGIKSLLMEPIEIAGLFGGIIGFSHFSEEKEWNEQEKEIVQKMALIMSRTLQPIYKASITARHFSNSSYKGITLINYICNLQSFIFNHIAKVASDVFVSSPQEIIGHKSLYDYFAEEDNREFFSIIRNCHSNRSYSCDVKLKESYKGTLWLKSNFCICSHNEKQTIQGFFYDITEKKLLDLEHRRRRAFLELLIENIPVGITVKNCNTGNYDIWNKEYEKITGINSFFALDKGDEQIFQETVSAINFEKEKSVKSSNQELIAEEEELFSRTGELKRVTSRLIPLEFDSKLDSILNVTQDVTDIVNKRVELQQAISKVEESDKLKTQFLANISHEFRTPLNAVYGFSEFLKNNKSVSEADREEYLGLIMQGAQRLIALMDNVINVSKLESRNISVVKSNFSLINMLTEIAQHYRLDIGNKHKEIELKLALPNSAKEIIFESDETNLRTIFDNLLSNAVKFTEKGTIDIAFSISGDNSVTFMVSDTGIGIERDQAKTIFELFRQSDGSYTREFGGIGVGLAICYQIIQLLGGEITLDSEKGKGSTFIFTIPGKVSVVDIADQDNHNYTHLDVGSTHNFSEKWAGKNILIVDDTIHVIKFFQAFFKHIKVDIEYAHNGFEAIEKCREFNFDLILMDVQMPEMDGLEATQKIREFNTKVPIIAQTAYAFDSDRMKLLKAGCDDYITKPINRRELLFKMDKYFWNKKAVDE
ncbi:MAG: response regulator [Candidatus Cloacimonadales bacterium]